MDRVDPITLKVIQNALVSVVDTMAQIIVRSARSSVIRENMDFSTALMDGDGLQVAQGSTLPVHLGAMEPALRAILDRYRGDIHPGDIFANNDPYEGASHLPDVFLFKPYFHDDRLIAWTGAIGHQIDIGGRVPGGNACDNTEIYQEGLRIPPVRLYERGKRVDALWRIIGKNVRVSDMVLGDLQSQVQALEAGEREVRKAVLEHGPGVLAATMKAIQDYTERATRAEIRALPKGEWTFTDTIDDDGIRPDPLYIKATIRITDEDVHVDFTGTSGVAKGSINPNFAFTKSCVYAALRCLMDPDLQVNSGFFRPFRVTAPEGCYVNPKPPAPVAARGLGGLRITQVILGAMAQALPGRIPAAWGGGEVAVSWSGADRAGKPFIFVEFNNDGPRGGGPRQDGEDGVNAPIANLANTPVEVVEATTPLRIRRYGFVADTEGAGEFRGGVAIEREYEVLGDEATLQVRSDRTKFAPWGLEGGHPGSLTRNILNPDGEARALPAKFQRVFKKGDVYRLVQAGGGGYGLPLDREPESVAHDVREGKLSLERAKEVYGVVLDSGTLVLHPEATSALRRALRELDRSLETA